MGDDLKEPEMCQFGKLGQASTRHHHHVYLLDFDSRRAVAVTLPNSDGDEPPDDDPELEKPQQTATQALRRLLPQLPPETTAVELDAAGALVSSSTDPAKDMTPRGHHTALATYDLPAPRAGQTILRSQLTELRRFLGAVDLVSYSDSKDGGDGEESDGGGGGGRYVFKNNFSLGDSFWPELQMLARLPPHPHLALVDRVVVDEVTGTRAVGFTMRYIEGEPLDRSRPPLKMKWLRQLMATVDDLNLKHGVIHQDIAGRNLMVDQATDSIVLIDFNVAYRVGVEKVTAGSEGRWSVRDDVKGVLVFLYEYITRDPALARYWLHLVDEKDVRDPAKWVKHPDVELDDDVAEFYIEAMAWARRRRAGRQMAHYREAPEPLEWPAAPTLEERERGSPGFLNWKRPPAALVDPSRRLLCTGRYADEEEAMAAAAVVSSSSMVPHETPVPLLSPVSSPVSRPEQPTTTTTKRGSNNDQAPAEAGRRHNLRPRKATTGPTATLTRTPTPTRTASPKRKAPESQGTAESGAGTGRAKKTKMAPAAKSRNANGGASGWRVVAARA